MEMDEYKEVVKQVLVPMFYKESQVSRSMRKSDNPSRANFNKQLFDSIQRLTRKVDDNTLTNGSIREEIKNLSSETNTTIGQAQKVINVYMKYYCIIEEKQALLKELDCPVDSGIVRTIWENLSTEDKDELETLYKPLRQAGIPLRFIYFQELTPLNKMDFTTYEYLQMQLERMGNGIRLHPDIEVYDKARISKFLEAHEIDDE
jgi:hypothetical protein